MKVFKCPNCENSYNRAQDLKSHQTKMGHKNPIVENDIITEDVQYSTMASEDLFNSEMDSEICDSTEESEAIYITRARRPRIQEKPKIKNVQDKSVQCDESQILSQRKQVVSNTGFNLKDKTSYLYKASNLLTELQTKVIDVQYNQLKELIIIDDELKIWNASQIKAFNVYESEEIDLLDRVTLGHPELKDKVSLQNYQFDNYGNKHRIAQNTKLGMKQNYDSIISKFIVENKVKFSYPEITPIYWDIETFNTKNFTVPLADDDNSHISMICAVRLNHIKIWLLDSYTFDISKINSKLQVHYPSDVTYEIILCEDDRSLARSFFSWLKSLTTLHYLCGFNATQGKSNGEEFYLRKPKCYDMDFLIKKGGLDTKLFRIVSQKWFNQEEISYSNYTPIPLVMFIDFKQIAQAEVSIKEGEIKGYKLDNILEFLGVKSKIQVDHIQMAKDSRMYAFDMSGYIAYCAYDCICLKIADTKHGLFNQLYDVIKLLKLPISTLANLTNAKKLQIALLKKYYKAGYSFTYSSVDYQESEIKHGALTLSVESQNQFKYLDKVISCDYTSQYPNAILQMNISPENISQTETKFCVDINFAKGDPKLVYFKDCEPVLSKLVKNLLSLKSQYKKQGLKSLEKAVKLCVNTIYGLTNQNSCPIFNYQSASAICAFGRISITYAMNLFKDSGYNILSVDTDGVECQIMEKVTKSPQDIAKEINDKYNSMVLEIKENTEFIFNNKKKAYLKRSEGQIEMKGFGSKNALSLYMREQITLFCATLLDNKPKNIEQIHNAITVFKNRIAKEVQECIDAHKSIESYVLFHKFTKQSNSSGILTKSGKLSERFGDKSVYKIIPFNFGESRKDYNYSEYSENMDLSLLQISELIELLAKPLTQFFQLKTETKMHKQSIKEGQIMLRVETQRQQFINVDVSEVETMVLANRSKCVYHEKILSDTCKLYFDIETKKDKSDNLVMVDMQKFRNILWSCLEQVFPIHIADGCIKDYKQSYHVVVDVIMTKSQMETLSIHINQKYNYDICDIGVYSGDQCMRLPLQYKWDAKTNKVGRKLLEIITHSKFTDFIIQNVTPQYQSLANPIAFCNKPHFQMTNPKIKNELALTILAEKYNLQCDYNGSYIIVPRIKPYKCPLSNCTHDSQNLYLSCGVIKCFALGCKGKFIEVPKQVVQADNTFTQVPLKHAQILNQEHVKYDTKPYKYTYVKSQMNTGKTFHLKKELVNYQDCYQIVVSFRRTFAQDFAQKMGFENYQEIKGGISLRDHSRVVVQIDSLHRIRSEGVNKNKIVLILDEIESILDQSQAFSYKPQVQQSFQVLLDLLQCSGKVIILDALMQDRTIWLINTLARNNNYQIVHNLFQPKSDQVVNLIEDKHTNAFKSDYQQAVLAKLNQGKKVVSFCSSRDIASGIVAMAEAQGYSVKIYHGKDAKVEDCHDGKNMLTAKTEDFKHIENITSDLFIYTSTITAGISIEKKFYNSSINYYAYNTCSPIQTIQALQRVRNITDNDITIYLDTTQVSSNLQTAQKISASKVEAYDKFITYDLIREMSCYLDARMNEQIAHKNKILLTLLADQGYTINRITKEYTTQKFNSVQRLINEEIKLTEEDLLIPDLIKNTDYLLKNQDKTLEYKLDLIHLYSIYKTTMTLEQFNYSNKAKLQADKKNQIEKLAWNSLKAHFDVNLLQQLTVDEAVKFIKLREEQINIQANWTAEVQNTITAKQRDVYQSRLSMLVHCQNLLNKDTDYITKYVSGQSSKFTKSFNQIIGEFFGYKLDNKQVLTNGERIRVYSLVVVK